MWHRLRILKALTWVWAWRKRMPALSWSVTERAWLSAGESPTKGELWAPRKVMLEYVREQSAAWPLQRGGG